MKWRQQSYALLVASACVALSAFMVATCAYDRPQPTREATFPDVGRAGMDSQAAGIAAARQALKALSAMADKHEALTLLPVAIASSVPLPASSTPVFDANGIFQLTTIVQAGTARSAIVNGKLVHVGDQLDASTVIVGMTLDSIKIKRDGQLFELTLRAKTNDQPASEGTSK
ncbi:general secretion pathway protein GspB [Burkholderia seminalis]|uniref:general secretion pathway protein GspB n=1 Tax=Burkholderia seminalis TaxID=488731 RepID=UPI001CF182D8|nr:general secretion pathway protein GspB [Burkholderia seminalis]MCA7955583.1 general secretion pathway protein GspB [Burkholderia seminalis]